jgi:hypothetical protein
MLNMIMMEDGELTKKSVAEMEEWQRQGLKSIAKWGLGVCFIR